MERRSLKRLSTYSHQNKNRWPIKRFLDIQKFSYSLHPKSFFHTLKFTQNAVLPESYSEINFESKPLHMKILNLLVGLILSLSLYSQDDVVSTLTFVGNGNLLNTINGESDDLDANTGLGAVLHLGNLSQFIFSELDMSLTVNVATTADSLDSRVRTLGSYLLRPINKKQSAELVFEGYFASKPFGVFFDGLHIRLETSTNRWFGIPDQTDNNGNSIETPRDLVGVSWNVGLFKEWVQGDVRAEKGYSFKTGINWAWRRLAGDLSFSENEALRVSHIGTDLTGVNGLELYISVRLRNIRATVSLPVLNNGFLGLDNDKFNIPGLSNRQLLTSISFVGGFPLSIGDGNPDSVAPGM